jgi:hypothetical protein
MCQKNRPLTLLAKQTNTQGRLARKKRVSFFIEYNIWVALIALKPYIYENIYIGNYH